ncbi:MAG: membrane protein insertase YidC [Candidatus Limimorpha sp.]
MNKNTLIGFILVGAVLFGWMMWMTPSKKELAEQQRVQDSIQRAKREAYILDSIRYAEQEQLNDSLRALQVAAGDTLVDSTALAQKAYNERLSRYGVFASASEGEEQTWTIENKIQKIAFSSKGGFVKSVELKDYKTYESLPLMSFDPETANFDLSFFAKNRTINTSELYFKPYLDGKPYEGGNIMVSEGDSVRFALRLPVSNGDALQDESKYIEFQYVVHYDDYMMDFNIVTVGLNDIMASNTNFMNINWNVDLMRQEKSVDRFSGSSVFYKAYADDDVDHLNETKDDEETVSTKLKWVSFKQRFFCNVIVAKDAFENAKFSTRTQRSANPRYLKTMTADLELPYDVRQNETVVPMSLYFGPNHFQTLRDYGIGLHRQINIGSFFLIRWINHGVILVFNWLGSYGWSYGIVILILTIIIKIILFPFAFKSYKSTAVMRVLKPEMDEINAKFPKEEDAMKKQQAIMTLQRQAGASPLSGCLPMLLQMPVLFAVFRFFPTSIELRQQPFLWADDLSTYDSILDLPFNIPGYGDHVSLFCLLMTITTVIYTIVNNKQMASAQNQQMKAMKVMMYLMPILFLGIFNSYSSGLSYYYMLANIITFIQMFIFRRLIKEDKVRATIEMNKKKPVKKSGFMKRLEEAQKAQMRQQHSKRR